MGHNVYLYYTDADISTPRTVKMGSETSSSSSGSPASLHEGWFKLSPDPYINPYSSALCMLQVHMVSCVHTIGYSWHQDAQLGHRKYFHYIV